MIRAFHARGPRISRRESGISRDRPLSPGMQHGPFDTLARRGFRPSMVGEVFFRHTALPEGATSTEVLRYAIRMDPGGGFAGRRTGHCPDSLVTRFEGAPETAVRVEGANGDVKRTRCAGRRPPQAAGMRTETAGLYETCRVRRERSWRRRADSNRRIEVLQTSALTTWLRRL